MARLPRRFRLVLAAGVLMACTDGTDRELAASSVLREAVVYGQDDRVEALDYPDAALVSAVTARVGALLPRAFVMRDADGWLLKGPALKDELALCEGEAFADQPRLAVCTAMLVRPDAILTAGHCMAPEFASDYVFVRDYYLSDTFPRVAADRVHELDALLLKVDGDPAWESTPDVAIARLWTQQPLPTLDLFARTSEAQPGEPVVVAGTTEGLPIKIDDGGSVFAARSSSYFEVTSDTFRGSSGSPVFDGDGQLLGMLSGGAADYEWDASSECYRRLAHDSPVARGEIVVGVDALRRELDRTVSSTSPAGDPARCSVAAAGRHGASLWLLAATLLSAVHLRRRARLRSRPPA